MNNPLLSNFLLPPFNQITDDCMVPAIIITINNMKKKINKILENNKNNYNWANFCQKILELEENLYRIFAPISNLNYVNNNKKIRKNYEIISKIITDYDIWFKQNLNIYKAYIYMQKNQNILNLDKLQNKSINNIIRDFNLSGILLNQKKKILYLQIIKKLVKLQNDFNNNIFDSTRKFKKYILDKKKLDGIPNHIIKIMHKNALLKNKKGYLISLDYPIYSSIITFCNNQNLRRKIYYKYSIRTSSLDNNVSLKNELIIQKELSLRLKLSNLLGYYSYSEQSLINKSAKKINKVLSFLYTLLKLSKKQAIKEALSLKNFVKKKYNITDINPWDVSFFAEKYKFYLYGINDNIIREYFPINIVIKGMFQIVNNIYGLSFILKKVSVWHKNVMFFNVFNDNNKLCGSIYFDLYFRIEKRSGAWMDICQSRILKSNGILQHPIAFINCNFTPSINNIFLLHHNDVLTLFHEFGHALHHITSCINIPNISGINGLPLDIIEFPSQFMEYWCWEYESLKIISQHYQKHKKMPTNIINKLVTSKKYNSALSLMRQIELSLFDIRIHNEFSLKKNDQISSLINEIRKDIITISPIPIWNKYTNTFNHIFGGEYAAGYYSYLWSEQLAADSFYHFKKNGLFNPIIGKNFLKNFLSLGNSVDPMILFEKFSGRKLNYHMLLKQRGIKI
ncbi:M3 family metallopeptidase [Enterobacteriaceae endosymbiont of Donacia piscatrix]|uniref:M3 family metallopeptidase n=1 Tax=Enterobacteriaceae endosymbiont of Donacia piscatrix TaxID=2675780 RepID=UPI0014490D38|nr:M3 family metallopeptidase [Enterobacteriaceae endosymbiont of Donacia piscatrix]QJC34856.1 oligopeptidase A [Enterobacteriaceae endosymbiont of Donacia piscatrix]